MKAIDIIKLMFNGAPSLEQGGWYRHYADNLSYFESYFCSESVKFGELKHGVMYIYFYDDNEQGVGWMRAQRHPDVILNDGNCDICLWRIDE